MRSPFPGMDPYLESHWLDVHPRLIVAASEQIQSQLGDDLVARIEERLVVEDPTGASRRIGPDVRIVDVGPPRAESQPTGDVMVAEPLVFLIESEPIVQRYLEIIDLSAGGRVVTVIEFVSPTNKLPGDGREQYQRKQEECRHAGINLVEIDLIRQGRRGLLAQRWITAPNYESTYQVSIWKAAWPGQCGLYQLDLRQRLPAIPIPLRPEDKPVVLQLQPLIDRTYDGSRYDRTIRYAEPCSPTLSGSDSDWADELLKAAGKR